MIVRSPADSLLWSLRLVLPRVEYRRPEIVQDLTEAQLRRGTTPVEILLIARKHHLKATIQKGNWQDLLKLDLQTKIPIIMLDVSTHLPLDQKNMHWVIISGYALDHSTLLLAAPHQRHHIIDKESFLTRWQKSDHCLILIETQD